MEEGTEVHSIKGYRNSTKKKFTENQVKIYKEPSTNLQRIYPVCHFQGSAMKGKLKPSRRNTR